MDSKSNTKHSLWMLSSLKTLIVCVLATLSCLSFGSESDVKHTLRIQTHFSSESPNGKNAEKFAEDVNVMSAGRLDIQLFFSSSFVSAAETFEAVSDGILDGDMTGAGYQTATNKAFQFIGDIVGGYESPWEQYSWMYYAGGLDLARNLYNQYGLHLLGWWIPGQESLSSQVPLKGIQDLEDWKFRSPSGLESDIFKALGAKPVAMDFSDVFNDLKTRKIDGTDASNISINRSLGLYDIVKHVTYPGFHSMPADHLAINKDLWDELPEDLKRILEVAVEKLAFRNSLDFATRIRKDAAELSKSGVVLHDWSSDDRASFREAAKKHWLSWSEDSVEAREIVDSHILFMKQIGLLGDDPG